jgi:hypothetical protein
MKFVALRLKAESIYTPSIPHHDPIAFHLTTPMSYKSGVFSLFVVILFSIALTGKFRLPTLPQYMLASFKHTMTSTANTSSLLSRTVAKKVLAVETPEGMGALVRRSIGTPALKNISPFLMLDHFKVAEGAGEKLFLVKCGDVLFADITRPLS